MAAFATKICSDICSWASTVPRNKQSFKRVVGGNLSAWKNISGQIEAVVFVILQTFFATHAVLKIGEYHSDILQF